MNLGDTAPSDIHITNGNANAHPPSRTESESETETHSSAARSSSRVLPIQKILHKTFKTIMNTVVTIFSMGVGVGMILGDSLHQRNSASTEDGNDNDASISNLSGDANASAGDSQQQNINGQASEESAMAMASTASLHSNSYSNMLPAQ